MIRHSPKLKCEVVEFYDGPTCEEYLRANPDGTDYTQRYGRYVYLNHALVAMSKYGGHFASNLGEAWLRADLGNSERLKSVFTHLAVEYAQREPERMTWDQVFYKPEELQ